LQDQKIPRSVDKVPAGKGQANFDDTDAAHVASGRANGVGKSNGTGKGKGKGKGHDEQARGNPQEVAEKLDGRHQDHDPADGARAGDAADDDPGVTDLPLDAFDAQVEAQSARNARAALAIGTQEFIQAHAADQARGFHGDGDVELTVAENRTHRLTKAYRASRDGQAIEKDDAKIRTGFGRLVRVVLSRDQPIASLAALLTGCPENQAFMPGRLPGAAPMRRMIIKAKFRALPEADRALAGTGPLFRGKDCIGYAPGKPALLIVDFDAKDLPDALREQIEQAGGLRAVLAAIDPQWNTIGFLERPSVSTGIRDKRTGVTTPGGGMHLYVIVNDGGDLERYVQVLFDRLVLAGFSWITLSTAGAMLERSPIDKAASGIGYWLAFEAHAVLETRPHGDHLEHVPGARQCRTQEGPRLDTQALADLTDDEQRQVAEIWAALKAEKEPEARAIKLARGQKDIARLVKVGVSKPEAERLVLARAELGRLSPDDDYWFDEPLPSGRVKATGWELLENMADWFAGGRTWNGADPLEPDYPNVGWGVVAINKAWWKINTHSRQAGLFVSSRAHGGQRFVLAYDAADVVALMGEMKARGDSAIVRLAQLKAVYRQAYLPVDQALSETILHQAGLPLPVVLEFEDPEEPELGELARERLMDVLRDQDWDQLGRLRCLGRFRDEALAELRDEDEVIGLGFTVDWDKVTATLAATDKAARDAEAAGTVLPVIEVRAGEGHLAANQAEKALAAQLVTHPVLQRGGVLVRPCLLPAKDADDRDIDAGGFGLMTPTMMTDDLAHSAVFKRFDAKAKLVPMDPPKSVAVALLSRTGGRLPLLPRVIGLTCAPTLRRDGSVLHAPGYDPTSRLYHVPSGNPVLSAALMGTPTRDDALAALELLIGLLVEFPFVGGVDRSVALSMFITPAVRGALRFAPMHLVRAVEAGTGKSFLVNLVHVVLSGRFCPATNAGTTLKETEARIDAMLLSGHPVFSLDNLTGELKSERLNSTLTEPLVGVRPLGESRMVYVDNTVSMFGTGNNVRPVGDLTRRVLVSDLDAQLERPELRQFKGDPIAAVMAARGRYLSACLIIPRAYMLAGSPGVLPPLAGFNDWSNLVRSALVWLGQDDPVTCLDGVYADDTARQQLRAVLSAWETAVGVDAPLTAQGLLDKADEYGTGAPVHPGFREALAAAVHPAPLDARGLGYWLREVRGTVAGAVRVVDAGMARDNTRLWALKPLG
jgi:putative DNA primase/helicase